MTSKKPKSRFRRAKERVDQFNMGLADLTTNAVGTMWTAYVFFIWALVPLEFHGMTNIVQYVSQSVIQLVLLPVIIVGQAVQAKRDQARAERDHKILEHLEVWRKHHEDTIQKAKQA